MAAYRSLGSVHRHASGPPAALLLRYGCGPLGRLPTRPGRARGPVAACGPATQRRGVRGILTGVPSAAALIKAM